VFINVYLSGLNVTKHLLKYQYKLSTLNLLPYFPLVKIVETKTRSMNKVPTNKFFINCCLTFLYELKRKSNKPFLKESSLTLRAFFYFLFELGLPTQKYAKTKNILYRVNKYILNVMLNN